MKSVDPEYKLSTRCSCSTTPAGSLSTSPLLTVDPSCLSGYFLRSVRAKYTTVTFDSNLGQRGTREVPGGNWIQYGTVYGNIINWLTNGTASCRIALYARYAIHSFTLAQKGNSWRSPPLGPRGTRSRTRFLGIEPRDGYEDCLLQSLRLSAGHFLSFCLVLPPEAAESCHGGSAVSVCPSRTSSSGKPVRLSSMSDPTAVKKL